MASSVEQFCLYAKCSGSGVSGSDAVMTPLGNLSKCDVKATGW